MKLYKIDIICIVSSRSELCDRQKNCLRDILNIDTHFTYREKKFNSFQNSKIL